MLQRRLLSLCIGAMAAVSSSTLWAQTPATAYPTKPVTLVIPFASGGPADIENRIYIPRLMEGLGQPVIVDYRPGATGSTGSIHVSKSAPDGYTILAIAGTITVYPATFPADKLPYDPVRDFAPISMITKRSTLLMVPASLGIKTFPEYVAYAKANPDKLNYGTVGSGGGFHIAGAWLHGEINASATFVHYKGAAPIFTDLLAGRITSAPAVMFAALPHIKSGKLVAVAAMSAERSKYLPDLKTVAEYGIAGFDLTSWAGYLAPPRTPEAIVNRLSAEFAKVARTTEIIKRMDSEGAEMVGSTPEQLRQVMITDTARWRRVVEKYGIKSEE